MSYPDTFFTIVESATGEFKDKGSKFLASVFPVTSEETVKNQLKKLRTQHHSAAHVCWAYTIGVDKLEVKSSDDREPSGSAGKPILRIIQEKKLTNVLIAVVRYFGGKLLGVPGLINAYGEAASLALDQSIVMEKRVFMRVFQPCEFENQHLVIRLAKQHQLKFFPYENESRPGIIFEVTPSKKDAIISVFQNLGLFDQIEKEVIYVS